MSTTKFNLLKAILSHFSCISPNILTAIFSSYVVFTYIIHLQTWCTRTCMIQEKVGGSWGLPSWAKSTPQPQWTESTQQPCKSSETLKPSQHWYEAIKEKAYNSKSNAECGHINMWWQFKKKQWSCSAFACQHIVRESMSLHDSISLFTGYSNWFAYILKVDPICKINITKRALGGIQQCMHERVQQHKGRMHHVPQGACTCGSKVHGIASIWVKSYLFIWDSCILIWQTSGMKGAMSWFVSHDDATYLWYHGPHEIIVRTLSMCTYSLHVQGTITKEGGWHISKSVHNKAIPLTTSKRNWKSGPFLYTVSGYFKFH